ncbi:erythrocyte membrane protein 1, PfEMP1, putative [Plasmodium sp.]|nr:erythrocyte membrane protein 1, PfEMP1, putative [Plasmodium sp.]
MAPQSSGGGGGGTKDDSVNDLFRRIGGTIQQQVHNAAEPYNKYLQGNLSDATFPHRNKFERPKENVCDLIHTHDTNVTVGYGREDPCLGTQTVRFSDTKGAECYSDKISDKDSNIGFCAPYRRLHLCVKNLEHIDPEKIENTHNLLVDVLLAGKYEGHSLVKQYEDYKKRHKDFKTNICDVLARSFADIGDIVRGKDLFLGHKQGKEHLEKRLETMFEYIKKNNNNKLNNLSTKDVREYWWALNRDQVWKAITCGATMNDISSRNSGNGITSWDFNCGHYEAGKVPTNLDYVPQYLRWFDEWSEHFCRKRNNTLKSAKKACRGENKEKYCSQNGYDCTKRIKKGESCSTESNCTACSNECIPYQPWLEKQRNEFNMQKDKYENEIKTKTSNNGISKSNTNKEYYKEFYDKLKENYESVEIFLNLLNNGTYCQEKIEEEDPIDFTKNAKKDAFYRSDYCQPCPDCVVVCNGKTCTEDKTDVDNCRSKINEKIQKSETPTEIKVLINDKGQGVITENLGDFCSDKTKDNDKNYKTWQCYNKNNDYNNCEMISWLYRDPKESDLMLSIQCFDSWAQNLLINTIRWEHQLKDCINNTNVTDCESKCNNNCKCYHKWINTKKNEWKQLKKVLENKKENPENYYKILNNLFDTLYFHVMYEFSEEKEKEKEKSKELTEYLQKKIASLKGTSGTADSEDAIEFLLDHLNDNATTCIDNNSLEDDKNCPKDKDNPCIKRTRGASNNLVGVKHIAETMQRRARKQLEENGGEINLKADATRGKYRNQGSPKDFENVCEITANHSNCTYTYSKDPCGGKDGEKKMFDINEGWKPGKDIDMTDEETYMPPRRQHFCTSNLEYLQTGDDPFSKNDAKLINDSFLGDVLLSAKFEADFVKRKYEEQSTSESFKDNATICQAIRYSFADIGDIIRGTDIWDKDVSTKKMESHLEPIFKKIKDHHPGIKDNQKYNGDERNKPPYKKLREDWWEANRHQVWRAMKCATKGISNNKCNGIPIEDYIPQRLRWMTELAEWYCKVQSKAYKDLSNDCHGCIDKSKSRENHNKNTQDCKNCKTDIEQYEKKIEKWKKQWRELAKQYSTLYGTAKVNAFKKSSHGSKIDVKEKDEPVYDFLLDLHLQNDGNVDLVDSTKPARPTRSIRSITDTNTPYDNAGAYVHDMVDLTGSMDEKEFCDRGIKYKPPPDNELPEEEAPAPEGDNRKTEEDKVCKMVDGMLEGNNGTKKIKECNTKSYNDWSCNPNDVDPDHAGACMPPRRQKLCVYFFAGNKVIDTINTQEDLRKAFIKSAAAETFLSWHKYKSDNKGDQLLQSQLEGGTIPEEFKRKMFYTYGDYRDFVFGTDISKAHGKNSNLGKKINKLFNSNVKKEGDLSPEDWWQQHGREVWNGMLCALSYDTTNKNMDYNAHTKLNPTYGYDAIKSELEDFASRPQFLRWFTEWSDEFCPEQKKRLVTLQEACDTYTCSSNDTEQKKKCQEECTNYKTWIQKKKTDYTTQSKKYDNDKETEPYNSIDDVNKSPHAHEYLHKQLQTLCKNVDCKCMEKPSTQQQEESPDITHMPASLDDEPEEVNGKCKCPSPKPPSPPAETDSTSDAVAPQPDVKEEEEEKEEEKDKGDEAASGPVEPPPSTPAAAPKLPKPPKRPPRSPRQAKKSLLPPILGASGFPWTVGIAFAALSYFVLKKKTKSSVGNLFQILQIPKSDYDIPTLKSSNRYIPYGTNRYKGKTYIYMEGDSSGDEKYAFMSDTTDVTSSESEYEELDINDIYVPGSPKYKTLIEVVLEPSKRDIQSDDIPTNKFTNDEWNKLKKDFISNMLQNQPKDVPNDYKRENVTLNTQPNTLYFDKPDEKPFITSIHDRNLYSGEEYNYNVNMVNNDDIPISGNNDVYSGIDLINDSLNNNNVDIYDELLKRKENELFGTNHPKHTKGTHNVTKSSNSDPIDNQLDLFHTWLDRHRDMCEQWNNKEEVLDKLKEEWNKDNNSGDIPSDSNKTLNTDVSIQIHMDNPKPINQFTNMDTILEDLEKYNEPYYDVQDDIYYDVHDHDASNMDSNAMDVPSKVKIEMDVNTKLVKEKYPISDVWDI